MDRDEFTCYKCKNSVNSCSRCPFCKDFGLCTVCDEKSGHDRKVESQGSGDHLREKSIDITQSAAKFTKGQQVLCYHAASFHEAYILQSIADNDGSMFYRVHLWRLNKNKNVREYRIVAHLDDFANFKEEIIDQLSNLVNALLHKHSAAAEPPLVSTVPSHRPISMNVSPSGQFSSTQAIASNVSTETPVTKLLVDEDDEDDNWITICSNETIDISDDVESSRDSDSIDVFNEATLDIEGCDCSADGDSDKTIQLERKDIHDVSTDDDSIVVLDLSKFLTDNNDSRASKNKMDQNRHASTIKNASTGAIIKHTARVEDNKSSAAPQNGTQAENRECAVSESTESLATDQQQEKHEEEAEFQMAMNFLAEMGFSTEGGWLSTLLKAVHCDVARALDIMSNTTKNGK